MNGHSYGAHDQRSVHTVPCGIPHEEQHLLVIERNNVEHVAPYLACRLIPEGDVQAGGLDHAVRDQRSLNRPGHFQISCHGSVLPFHGVFVFRQLAVQSALLHADGELGGDLLEELNV